MTLDPESFAIARTTIIFAVLFLLAAKVWRECAIEVLRRKLQALEIELFEFARHGHLTVGHPAYAMVRNSITNLAASAHEMSVTRLFLATALGSAATRAETLARHHREWEAALGQVSGEDTRLGIVDLRERLHLEVRRCLLFGPVPVESLPAVTAWLTAPWQRICLQLARRARFAEIDAKSVRRVSVPA